MSTEELLELHDRFDALERRVEDLETRERKAERLLLELQGEQRTLWRAVEAKLNRLLELCQPGATLP